jgi:hypothetical protein
MFAASSDGLRKLGVMDNEFGRWLPPLLRAAGLRAVRSTATYDISAPGSDYARWNELTCISGREGFAAVPGVTPDDVDAMIDALRDPTFHMGEMTMVRAVGHRR